MVTTQMTDAIPPLDRISDERLHTFVAPFASVAIIAEAGPQPDEVVSMAAELLALRTAKGTEPVAWRQMDDCPRDGTWLELKTPLQTVRARWAVSSLAEDDDDEGWVDAAGMWVLEEGEQPTHYRPSPAPAERDAVRASFIEGYMCALDEPDSAVDAARLEAEAEEIWEHSQAKSDLSPSGSADLIERAQRAASNPESGSFGLIITELLAALKDSTHVPEGVVLVDTALLAAACGELRQWKVDKGGDDQVVLNLEAILADEGNDGKL